jgi:hypothetical protein
VNRLPNESLAELKVWVDEQAAALRAAVALPRPEPSPEATADATSQPSVPPTDPTHDASAPTDAGPYAGRRAKRASNEALAELVRLVTAGLDADAISSDVDLSR